MDCPFCQQWTSSAADHVPWSVQAFDPTPSHKVCITDGVICVEGLSTKIVSRVGGNSSAVEQYNNLRGAILDDSTAVPWRTCLALFDYYPPLAAKAGSTQCVTINENGVITVGFEAGKQLEDSDCGGESYTWLDKTIVYRDSAVAVCQMCPVSAALLYSPVCPSIHDHDRVSRRYLYQLLFLIPDAQGPVICVNDQGHLVYKVKWGSADVTTTMWWNECGVFLKLIHGDEKVYCAHMIGTTLTCSRRHPWRVKLPSGQRMGSMLEYWKAVFCATLCAEFSRNEGAVPAAAVYSSGAVPHSPLPYRLMPTGCEETKVVKAFVNDQKIPDNLVDIAGRLLKDAKVTSTVWDHNTPWGALREYASKVAISSLSNFLCFPDEHAAFKDNEDSIVTEAPVEEVPPPVSDVTQSVKGWLCRAPWDWTEDDYDNVPALFKQACGMVIVNNTFDWDVSVCEFDKETQKPKLPAKAAPDDDKKRGLRMFEKYKPGFENGCDLEEVKRFWLWAYIREASAAALCCDEYATSFYAFWPESVTVGDAVWAELFGLRPPTTKGKVPEHYSNGRYLNGTYSDTYDYEKASGTHFSGDAWKGMNSLGVFSSLSFNLKVLPNKTTPVAGTRTTCTSRDENPEIVSVGSEPHGAEPVHWFVVPPAEFSEFSVWKTYNKQYLEANGRRKVLATVVPRQRIGEWHPFPSHTTVEYDAEKGLNSDDYGYFAPGNRATDNSWKPEFDELKLPLWHLYHRNHLDYSRYVRAMMYQKHGGVDSPLVILRSKKSRTTENLKLNIYGLCDDNGFFFRHGVMKVVDGQITGKSYMHVDIPGLLEYTVYTNKGGSQFVASPNELCTAAQTGVLTAGLTINVTWKQVVGTTGKYLKGYKSGVKEISEFEKLFRTARDALKWCAPYFDPDCHPGKSWSADWNLSDLQNKARHDKTVPLKSKQAAMKLLFANSAKGEFETFVKKLAWSFRHPPPDKKLESDYVSKWQDVWHSLDRKATKPSIVCPRYCAEKFHYYPRLHRSEKNNNTINKVNWRCENEYWFAKIGRTRDLPHGHCFAQTDFAVTEQDESSEEWVKIDNPATESDEFRNKTVANVCVIGSDDKYTYYRLHAISGGFYSYKGVQRQSGKNYGILRAVDGDLRKSEATNRSSVLGYAEIGGIKNDWPAYFKQKNVGDDNIVWDFPEEDDDDSE